MCLLHICPPIKDPPTSSSSYQQRTVEGVVGVVSHNFVHLLLLFCSVGVVVVSVAVREETAWERMRRVMRNSLGVVGVGLPRKLAAFVHVPVQPVAFEASFAASTASLFPSPTAFEVERVGRSTTVPHNLPSSPLHSE